MEAPSDAELGVTRGEERPILQIQGQSRDGVQSPTAQFQAMTSASSIGTSMHGSINYF